MCILYDWTLQKFHIVLIRNNKVDYCAFKRYRSEKIADATPLQRAKFHNCHLKLLIKIEDCNFKYFANMLRSINPFTNTFVASQLFSILTKFLIRHC